MNGRILTRRWSMLGLLALIVVALTLIWAQRSGEEALAGGAPGRIHILKNDAKTGLPLGGACFLVLDSTNTTLIFPVCDNDFQGPPVPDPFGLCTIDGTPACEDKDPALGSIVVNGFFGGFTFHVVETKAPPFYNVDGSKLICFVPPVPPPGNECVVKFFDAPKTSEINITKLSQRPAPQSCYRILTPAQVLLFRVCDNNFQAGFPESNTLCDPDGTTLCEDADPANGSIRVVVSTGTYHVTEFKAPPLHTPDPTKQICNAAGGNKCELTFVNTPTVRPWFPWDVDGNGAVAAPDFFAVLGRFGQCKKPPVPC